MRVSENIWMLGSECNVSCKGERMELLVHFSCKQSTPTLLKLWNFNFNPLCLATATHSFNLAKITHICLILEQTFANINA